MRQRWFVLFSALLLCCVSGCDTSDSAALQIDLTQLNWQTGALIALAYFANSKGHLGTISAAIKSTLQSLRILPGEKTPEALTAEQVQALLIELLGKLHSAPEVQAEILKIQAGLITGKVAGNAKAK